MKNLQSEFCNDQAEHFSYYDYLQQVNLNGQYQSLYDTLKELDSSSLFVLLRNNGNEFSYTVMDGIQQELESRQLKKYRRA